MLEDARDPVEECRGLVTRVCRLLRPVPAVRFSRPGDRVE